MAVLDDIINSRMIGDSLDLGAKYAAERARMSAGEKRIADAKSNVRNMEIPDFQQAALSEAGKVMASAMNTSEAEPMLDEARRGLLGFLDASRTRGQRRQLAKGLRAQGTALQKILSADRSARLAAAGAVSPEMQAVDKENRALDRERKLFDFRKDRQIEALEDQATRLKGAYGETEGAIQSDVLKMIRENPNLMNIFKNRP